jgi:hypothetical protein
MSDVRTEFGFERTECACEECIQFCVSLPGSLIPADLEAISAHLGYSELVQFAVENVTSKRRCDCSGGFSPFYTEVNATIHISGRDRVTFLQKSMRLD